MAQIVCKREMQAFFFLTVWLVTVHKDKQMLADIQN